MSTERSNLIRFFGSFEAQPPYNSGDARKRASRNAGLSSVRPRPGAERKQRGSEYEVAKRNVGRLHFSAGCRAAAVARCSAVTSHGKSDVQTNRFAGNFPVEDDSHSSRESDGFRSGPGRTQERNAQKTDSETRRFAVGHSNRRTQTSTEPHGADYRLPGAGAAHPPEDRHGRGSANTFE